MESLPYVSVYKDDSGATFVLIRQAASGGQYIVDICLTMAQFSGLMAVLTGLETHFTNQAACRMANNTKNDCDARSTVNNMNYEPANVDSSSSYPIEEILSISEPRTSYIPCPVSPYDPTNPSMQQRLGGEEMNTGASYAGGKRPYFVGDFNPQTSEQQPSVPYTAGGVDGNEQQKTKKIARRPRKKKSDTIEPVKAVAAVEGVTTLLPPSYFA